MGSIRRREFGQVLAATGLGLAAGSTRSEAVVTKKRRIPLGFDNYSIRALGWKAPRLIRYASSLGLDSCLLSDLHVYKSHDESYLKEIRSQAQGAGIRLHVGTGSICPTSSSFKTDFGSAEEHLELTIRIARVLGSPVARCFLGTRQDRLGPDGIEPHMKSTIQVFRKLRSRAVEAGVRIAIENHAGDMQARETVRVIEEAGSDFVGATVDSGNATWSLEDPVRNLEILGPYAVSSGIRDSMVWEDAAGARVQWAAMGDGCVDLETYMDRFAQLCPGVPIQLETISGVQRSVPYLKEDFWSPYPAALAQDFAAFVALAKRGSPLTPLTVPEGVDPAEAAASYQKAELERSVHYCKEVLGLGLKS